MKFVKFIQLILVTSTLTLGASVIVSDANAATAFQKRFVKACVADDNPRETCSCRSTKVKQPKTKKEADLMISVIQRNDAKVKKLGEEIGTFRALSLINSLTRGLMACSF